MKKINRKWRHRKYFVLCLLGIGVIVALSGYLLFSAGSGQKPEWKGTMRTENGVVIVENPAEPLYRNASLTLTEELSLGGKDAVGDSELASVKWIDADTFGYLYVLDERLPAVKVFDVKGRFVKIIGAKGQGPGEYQAPHFLQVVRDKELAVKDLTTHKMIYYSLSGEFLRENRFMNIPGTPYLNHIDEKGVSYAMSLIFDINSMIVDFIRIDPDCEAMTSIVRKEYKDIRKVFPVLTSDCFSCLYKGDKAVWGDSREYVLHVEEDSGKLLRTVGKKGPAVKITDDEKSALTDDKKVFVAQGMKLDIPENYSFFKGISVCEDSRIIVRTYEKAADGTADFYDVFDAEGRYIAKISLPSEIKGIHWKNNKLYCIVQDKEGFPLIKRYAVKWTLQ